MNNKLAQLAERRQQLVAQAADQRSVLAHHMEPWRARLALVDRGVTVVRYLRFHPGWIAGGTLLFAALRPRRFGKWLQRGWLMWRLGRRFLRS